MTPGWSRSGGDRGPMQTDAIAFLLSPEGRAAAAALSDDELTPSAHLATAERLRAELGSVAAGAVLELAQLRRRARAKFAHADAMFFTRDGLEQATAEPVAAHRAARFGAAGAAIVADLGCGIGGDALALARTGATVMAVDLLWAHVALAQANALACGLADRLLLVQADLMQLAPLPVDSFFFDPARRTPTGPRHAPERRLRSVKEYRPPLNLIDGWRAVVSNGAVKISPGVDYAELPPDAETEFVSLDGEVKEAVLWFGELRTAAMRRATLLPGGQTLTSMEPENVVVAFPRAFLYEPDGAIIRAHLVGQLAARLNATLIDPEIAYLSGDAPLDLPLARSYQIEAHFPFALKRLRGYLRERRVGSVTIKKRGSPLDLDDLRQALRLRGEAHRTLFLTRVMGRPTVLVAD